VIVLSPWMLHRLSHTDDEPRCSRCGVRLSEQAAQKGCFEAELDEWNNAVELVADRILRYTDRSLELAWSYQDPQDQERAGRLWPITSVRLNLLRDKAELVIFLRERHDMVAAPCAMTLYYGKIHSVDLPAKERPNCPTKFVGPDYQYRPELGPRVSNGIIDNWYMQRCGMVQNNITRYQESRRALWQNGDIVCLRSPGLLDEGADETERREAREDRQQWAKENGLLRDPEVAKQECLVRARKRKREQRENET
jgi:hypothetical protein